MSTRHTYVSWRKALRKVSEKVTCVGPLLEEVGHYGRVRYAIPGHIGWVQAFMSRRYLK